MDLVPQKCESCCSTTDDAYWDLEVINITGSWVLNHLLKFFITKTNVLHKSTESDIDTFFTDADNMQNYKCKISMFDSVFSFAEMKRMFCGK